MECECSREGQRLMFELHSDVFSLRLLERIARSVRSSEACEEKDDDLNVLVSVCELTAALRHTQSKSVSVCMCVM